MILKAPPTGVEGVYWFRTSGKTRGVIDYPVSKNLITNEGLNRLGATPSGQQGPITYCSVGTGTTTPAFTDTALVGFLASTQTASPAGTSVTNQSSSLYYAQYTFGYRFALGAVVGNVSEVGVGWMNDGTGLFSRARILNDIGVPTTITVLSDEVLDVYYGFRVYPPETDVTGSITISGVPYTYILRARNVTGGSFGWSAVGFVSNIWPNNESGATFTGAIAALTSSPTGGGETTTQASTKSLIAYSNGSYQRDSVLTWALNDGNVAGGAKCLSYSGHNGGSRYQVQFTPNIPKDDTKVLTLTTRHSWARHP